MPELAELNDLLGRVPAEDKAAVFDALKNRFFPWLDESDNIKDIFSKA